MVTATTLLTVLVAVYGLAFVVLVGAVLSPVVHRAVEALAPLAFRAANGCARWLATHHPHFRTARGNR